MTETVYVVKTNLPPEMLSLVALEIFALWLDFAMGRGAIGGKKLVYPTGRYAASLSYKQEGESAIAIMADAGAAPEANILETGHRSFDMKTKYAAGRYPMHRLAAQVRGSSLRRIGGGPPGATPKVWAEVRKGESTGFATIGPNSSPDSWIMPAMPAYSPAMILAAQAKVMAEKF